MKKTVAIVLAGGTGERMNAGIPKQFLELKGKPVIAYSLERFEKSGSISDIVVVCHQDHMELMKELAGKNSFKKLHKIVPGGKTRQGSSYEGIKNCPPGTELVLIHDAVRPFIDERIIKDVLAAADEAGAAGPVIDTSDTIVIKKRDNIVDIPDRQNVKRIQTPQGFRYKTILEAHERAMKEDITDSTDDCGMVALMGEAVELVNGSAFNIKITDRTDILLAENFLKTGVGRSLDPSP
ncbi:MAG: 2-C-methyl-D-erythritol 4-phosphate cytidylyltransferase [Candidatus Omnitrophota bacterium]|nr:2-C-methyl-D-erythritol 4-phosphate cytidylyltransferase [Candidatus Omnitrophota bacterium]